MSKPTIHDRAREMICPECGGKVERRSKHGPTPVFDTPECRRKFNNRALSDGAGVIAYLKAWRIDRGTGPIAQAALARICRIVDEQNDQDAKAGRPRADLYAAKLLDSPVPPVNELRYGRRKRAEESARKDREAQSESAKEHQS